MSGRQFVKKGVKEAFLLRLNAKMEEGDDGDEEEVSQLKTSILQRVKEDPSLKESLAEKCVSFFSVHSDIASFKKQWQESLDQLPEKLRLSDEGRSQFEKRMEPPKARGQSCRSRCDRGALEYLRRT